MSESKFCLLMIVRDESPIITRALNSLKNIFDSYIISDTGSTDDTIDVINTWMINNNKDFFDWFCSINPDLYNVKYDDMNNITDFYIFNNNLKLEIKNCSELLSIDNYEDIDNYKYIDILKIPLINNDALLENNDALLENNEVPLENNDKLSSIIKSFIENYDL